MESIRKSLFGVARKGYLFLDYVKFLAAEPKYKTFTYKGKEYKRCRSFRRGAFCTERAVEIPIIKGEISTGMRILEVGNVLHGHCNIKRDVVDKYEKSKGVINCDIVDYKPDEKYDIVVSISTLEHVGFDEEIIDLDKPIKAVNIMRSLIKPTGCVIITVPLGYNEYLDHRIAERDLGCKKVRVMHRVSKYDWVQEEYSYYKKYTFNKPFLYGNYVAIMKFDALN